MPPSRRAKVLAAVAAFLPALLAAQQAHAYIGPGAGFAFVGSLLVLLATFAIAFAIILTWPVRLLYRLVTVGNPYKHAKTKRVVILGLDGMDPGLTTKLMREGRMPHFQKLADRGVFRPLDTSVPSMSPVAWSTFATGVDASHHCIYDFLTRDPCTYAPMLSSTDIVSAKRVLNIGRYVIPLSKARMKLLQKSQHFWKLLGEKNIFSIIQRVPITFPPVPFKNGMLLSGMCVPDLRGSQGTFSFFSTETADGTAKFVGGEQTVLRRRGDVIRSRIVGPDHTMLKSGGRMTLPFTLVPAGDGQSAELTIEGLEPITLKLGEYSDWVELAFDAGLRVKVRGIAKFYLVSAATEVNLYMTPIHIDPENPAMPIAHPEGLRDLPGQEAGQVRDAGARRGHLGAQQPRDRREGLLRPGDVHLRRARADVSRRDQAVEEGTDHHRLRHHRPRAAHVLPLPGPHPPRQRGQGHRGLEGRHRPGLREDRPAARQGLAPGGRSRTPPSW